MISKKIHIPYKKAIFANIRFPSEDDKPRRKIIIKNNSNNIQNSKTRKTFKNLNSNIFTDGENTKADSATESVYEIPKKIILYKKGPNNDSIKKIYDCTSKNSKFCIYNKVSPRKKILSFRNTSADNLINPMENIKLRNVLNEAKLKNFNNFNKSVYNVNNYNMMRNNSCKNFNHTTEIINLEDLIILEGMFNNILSSIKNYSNLKNDCFELINFYNYSSLYNKFEKFFNNLDSKTIIHFVINIILFDVMLTYHCSFSKLIFNKNSFYLSEIIKLNQKCFLLLCEEISDKIFYTERGNKWVARLNSMLNKNLKHINPKTDKTFIYIMNSTNSKNPIIIDNIIEIKYYLQITQNYIKEILNNLIGNEFQEDFINIYNNISIMSSGEIIKFFRKKIIRVINKEGSVYGNDEELFSFWKNSFTKLKEPYLNFPCKKKFTLVLDLDETLISFKLIENSQNKGTLRIRPGLNDFLFNMKKYYELILFTSALKEYADPLLDIIEKKEKFFDYRLYRNHTVIYNKDFIKDIHKLGRSIKKIIIIDNSPQNLRLQKENGIMIKAFWGDNKNDTALYELKDILIKIACKFEDVREGIAAYKDDILSKVSSNYY